MQRGFPQFVLLALLAIATRCPAPVLDFDYLSIDFASEKDARMKSEWSDGTNFNEHGVGSSKKDWSTWWVQTKPLAIGLTARPASGASVTVTIAPPLESSSPSGGVFARYSPDYKHWSSWQALSREEKENVATIFRADLDVPNREQAKYNDYLEKYQKLHPNDDANEEAVVRWLIQQEPNFFEHSLPFIGYIEFLFEGPPVGGWRIKKLDADVQWGVGGLGLSTKSDLKTRWRFKAP